MAKKRTLVDKTNQIIPEFIGLSSINNFIPNTSSPRGTMGFGHFSSHLPVLKPDSKLIKSGIEFELGKYINHVSTNKDCTVKAIISRYGNYGLAEVPEYLVIVEYEEGNNLFLDYLEVKTFESTHSYFGYQLHLTDTFKELSVNQRLSMDTILSKADSYKSDTSYGYGLNANIILMTHPSVSEDGFVVSESFLKRMQFNNISKRVININKNTLPINMYGNNDSFRFIPDIGETVREDGLLCAVRDRNDWFNITDISNASLGEVDMNFDTLTYVSPGSTVIDVKVLKGNYNKTEFTNKMASQLDHYADMLVTYNRNIISQVNHILGEKKAMYGNSEYVRLTPKLHRLMTDTQILIDSSTNPKIKLCYRKLPIDQYRVEITTMSTITPNVGVKITDLHACKGVICSKLPDDQMPFDKNGVRADIITDSTSTISRMNLGRVYEGYLGSVSRDNKNFLVNYLTNKYNKHINQIVPILDNEDITYITKYLKGLYELINTDMIDFISALNSEDLYAHISEVLLDNMYLFYPINNDKNIVDVIDDIEKSIYKPLNDKVTYTDDVGNVVETKENIRVGNAYIMILEKIANTYMGVSSAKINNFSFPVKGTNNDKHKYPHALTPTKTLGETEVRILASYMGVKGVSELLDLTGNPASHKLLVKNILERDKPTKNDFPIDRNILPLGSTKPLLILKHILTSAGFDFQYEAEEKG